MKEDMIEDMTFQDGETEKYIQSFYQNLEENKDHDWYLKLRNVIIKTFIWDVLGTAFQAFLAEITPIGYTFTLIYLINFI